MKTHIQFLTTPTADTPGTALLLHFDNKRYVIGNVHEGFQRAGMQFGARFARVHDIFVTGKTEWKSTGGLLGLVITLADSTQAASLALAEQARAKLERLSQGVAQRIPQPSASGIMASKPAMNVHGGPNLMHMFATARRFIFRKGAPLRVLEVEGRGHDIVDGDRKPDWADGNIQVWKMAISNSAVASSPKSPRKRSFTEFSDHQGQTDKDQELRRHVISEMFDSSWRLDILEEKPLSQVPGLETAMFIRDTWTKKLRRYYPPSSEDGTPLPDINVLVRKAWPGALINELPQCQPSPIAMSYIFRGHRRRGKFSPHKARELNVPYGPSFGRLANGENVQSLDGKTVTPDMVMGEAKEGGGVAVIDLPSKEYVENLINRPEWNSETIMAGVGAVVWLLGPGVGQDPRIRTFMTGHSQWKHIISSTDLCPNYLAMSTSANSAIRLSRINSQIFPIPVHDNNVPSQHGSVIDEKTKAAGVVAAQQGLMIQLEPTFQIQDTAVSPFLDGGTALKTVPKEALDLARLAKQEISSELSNSNTSQDLPSGDAEIITLGTGSSLPSKYRNVSATLLRVPGHGSYLLDCGEGTLGQLRRVYGDEGLKEVLRDLKLIWISHLHADHHLGTVSVINAWRDEVHGQDALQDVTQSPNRSPDISPFSSTIDIADPVKVLEEENRLVIVGTGQMMNWLKEYAGVEDFGLDNIILLESVAPWSAKDPQFYLKWHHRHAVSLTFPTGFKFSYSGDCRPSEEFARIGKGSTVLLHEATFDDERQGDAEAKKHSTISEAIGVGMAMGAKRVVLTHFSQRYQKIPVMEDVGFMGVKLERVERTEESEISILDAETADLPTRPSQDDSVPQNNDTTKTNPTLGNVVSNEPSDITEAANVQSIGSPKTTPKATFPTPVDAKSEFSVAVIPSTVDGMKVCVAFDYMRIKVEEIAHMEKYAPALIELYKQESIDDNVVGKASSVEQVSDESEKKGKKKDGSDDEGSGKENKEKTNERTNRSKSESLSQKDKNKNKKVEERKTQTQQKKGQEGKSEGRGREAVGEREIDQREIIKDAADTKGVLLDAHRISSPELPLETHESANIPSGDGIRARVERGISVPEDTDFINQCIGREAWHNCLRSSFEIIISTIGRYSNDLSSTGIEISPENAIGLGAQRQEGMFSVVPTTMAIKRGYGLSYKKIKVQGHLANSGVPIADCPFSATAKVPKELLWPKPGSEMSTELRKGSSTNRSITSGVSSFNIEWEICAWTVGLTTKHHDGHHSPQPGFGPGTTGREASVEKCSSFESLKDPNRSQEASNQEISTLQASHISPVALRSRRLKVMEGKEAPYQISVLVSHSMPTALNDSVSNTEEEENPEEEKNNEEEKSTEEEKNTKEEKSTNSPRGTSGSTNTSPPRRSARYPRSHRSQVMKQRRSSKSATLGWDVILKKVARRVKVDMGNADC
ncbi:MAG: hypothetical protein Q9195_008279 [Heterodermia aff. obscurata]